MAAVLQNRRFATYLVVSCGLLLALAAAGPGSFLIGMCAIVIAEVASTMSAHEVRNELRTLGA